MSNNLLYHIIKTQEADKFLTRSRCARSAGKYQLAERLHTEYIRHSNEAQIAFQAYLIERGIIQ